MTKISIRAHGFDLLMDFDPNDELDQEIMYQVFLLIYRRKSQNSVNQGIKLQSNLITP